MPIADFGAVFACISFAHDNSASKTGFSCSSRFSYRSSGVSSAKTSYYNKFGQESRAASLAFFPSRAQATIRGATG